MILPSWLRQTEPFPLNGMCVPVTLVQVALELVPADADALATVNDLSAAGALYDAAVMDAMRFPDDDDDL